MVDAISVEEISKLDRTSVRNDYLVIQFCSVEDVPIYQHGYFYDSPRQDIYIKAYISKDLTIPGMVSRSDFGKGEKATKDFESYLKTSNSVRQIGRMSDFHFTLRKHDEGRAIWNSYHNFKVKPPKDALLTVELYHASRKQSMQAAERAFHHGETPDAAHGMLGSAHIPLDQLTETSMNVIFEQASLKNPKFSVNLRRVYADKPPQSIKTLFLIRHGESKWNLAQEHGDVRGMLHRDHSLTKTGVEQASAFHASWSKYHQASKPLAEVHADEVAGYAKEVLVPPKTQSMTQPTSDKFNFHTGSQKSSPLANSSVKLSTAGGQGTSSEPPAPSRSFFSSLIPSFLRKTPAPASALEHAPSQGQNQVQVLAETSRFSDADCEDTRSRSSSIDMHNDTNSAKLRSASAGSDILEQNDSENEEETQSDTRYSSKPRSISTFETEAVLQVPKAMVDQRVEYIKQFLNADVAYVSPLTRAIQTSLFTLYGHKAIKENGIHVMSTLREFKGPGGLDTVGLVVGAEIKERVTHELIDTVGAEEAYQKVNIPFHILDAELHWWTDIHHYEGKREMNDRMCEFLDFAQFCEAEFPIFVGHSNFFRYFYSNYMSEVVQYNRPYLCANLRHFRLANACCLAVTVLFEEEEDEESNNNHELNRGSTHGSRGSDYVARNKHSARIIDADIIFSDTRLSFANGSKAVKSGDMSTHSSHGR